MQIEEGVQTRRITPSDIFLIIHQIIEIIGGKPNPLNVLLFILKYFRLKSMLTSIDVIITEEGKNPKFTIERDVV